MSQISEQVLRITVFYLGPASRHFLDYICQHYMKDVKFDNLTEKNLPELSQCIIVCACLFVGKEKAGELSAKVLDLCGFS